MYIYKYVPAKCILYTVRQRKTMTSRFPVNQKAILVQEHHGSSKSFLFKWNTLMFQTHALLPPLVGGMQVQLFLCPGSFNTFAFTLLLICLFVYLVFCLSICLFRHPSMCFYMYINKYIYVYVIYVVYTS